MTERGRAGKERKRGSHGEWKQDGSIYRLLSSDASGITFVRFAGVDDVVARGVGVISTREGTYLPITVPSLFPPCAHIRTHLLTVIPALLLPSFSFIPPTIFSIFSFPLPRSLTHSFYHFATLVRESRSDSRPPLLFSRATLLIFTFLLIYTV